MAKVIPSPLPLSRWERGLCSEPPLPPGEGRGEGFGLAGPGLYGAGYTLGYFFSIPSSFIAFSIASMSHGASFEMTSAPFSVMKIMSSSRTDSGPFA